MTSSSFLDTLRARATVPAAPAIPVTADLSPHARRAMLSHAGIAPLDRFVSPPGLDGQHGVRRDTVTALIDANDDLAAIKCWIEAAEVEETARSRRAAGEKLINWANYVCGKAVSSLDTEDFAAFSRFLADPYPVEHWINPERTPRDSPRWRPFKRVPSPGARKATLQQVSALATWLAEKRYANLMPLYGVRAMNHGFSRNAMSEFVPARHKAEGSMSLAEWECLRQTLDVEYPKEEASPERLIVELLYYGDCFASDLAKLTRADFAAPDRWRSRWRLLNGKHLALRDVLRNHRDGLLPKPLSQTLTAWFAALEPARPGHITIRLRPLPEPLFAMTAPQIAAKAKQVLRHASRLSLEAGRVELGMQLRERSLLAFRGAYGTHQRPIHWHPDDEHDLTRHARVDPKLMMWAYRHGLHTGPFDLGPQQGRRNGAAEGSGNGTRESHRGRA